MRTETRRQRYNRKAETAVSMPVSIATINFSRDANLAYVIRSAACFGSSEVCVIGSTYLNRDLLNDLSGSTYDYVGIRQFSSPSDFIQYSRLHNTKLVSFELPDANFPAVPLSDYQFDFSRKSSIIVGHETLGVPVEILQHSDRVFIPMTGVCFCLNTAQTANLALYCAAEQYRKSRD